MPKPSRHIGLSLGMIGSLSDGLGEFSTQICDRIAASASAWREEGVQVHLHLPGQWHGRFGLNVNYLPTHKIQGYWHWQPGLRFDLWHGLNQLGRIVPPRGTGHALLTIHDLNPIYHDAPDDAAKAIAKLRARLRHFNAVTTLTHHVETDVRRHLEWRGPLSIVPNGARDLSSHPMEPVPGVPNGGFLLHLSRMARSKNPESLVELAAIWPEQRFVLAGPRTEDSNRLLAQAQERGLSNLTFVQEVSDSQKAWLYSRCLGFLFPSFTEGFGLPPLEAMHFGKPVFLSRLTSLPEVGGDRAAYFDNFEPQHMRRIIEASLPRLLLEQDAIRAHAATFTWDRAADAYVDLYRRALPGLKLPLHALHG
ncbi:glycosyltransferase [Sphaerotilaceae bacterium SBD11-9]